MNNHCWAVSRGLLSACSLGCASDMPTIRKLPDIRQDGAHDCGHAAMRCVIEYHQPGAVVVVNLASPQWGMDPATMESLFRAKLSWNTSCGERTVDELEYYCNDGRPVITPIQLHGTGHYVVVRHVTRNRVYYHDPVDGAGWMTVADWVASWRDGGRWGEFNRFGLVAWPGPAK